MSKLCRAVYITTRQDFLHNYFFLYLFSFRHDNCKVGTRYLVCMLQSYHPVLSTSVHCVYVVHFQFHFFVLLNNPAIFLLSPLCSHPPLCPPTNLNQMNEGSVGLFFAQGSSWSEHCLSDSCWLVSGH